MKSYLIFISTLIGLFTVSPNASSFGPQKTLPETDNISIVKFDPSGSYMAIGYASGKIEMWKINKQFNQIKWVNSSLKGRILTLGFLVKNDQMIVVNEDLGITFLNREKGNILKTFSVDFGRSCGSPEMVSVADFNQEKGILAIAGNCSIDVFLIRTDLMSIDTPKTRSTPYPTKLIPSNLRDPAVVNWLFSLNGELDVNNCLKISPSADFVLSGTLKGKLIKWDLNPTAKRSEIIKRNLGADSTKAIEPAKIIHVMTNRNSREFGEIDASQIFGIDCTDSLAISVGDASEAYGDMQIWRTCDMGMVNFISVADPSTCAHIKLSSNSEYAVTTGDFSYRIWKNENDSFKRLCTFYFDDADEILSDKACIDFYRYELLAIGDKQNVYFYKLPSLEFLTDIRNTNRELQRRK